MEFALWIQRDGEQLEQREPIVVQFGDAEFDELFRVALDAAMDFELPPVDGVVRQDLVEGDGETFSEESLARFAARIHAGFAQFDGGVEEHFQLAFRQDGDDPSRSVDHVVQLAQLLDRKRRILHRLIKREEMRREGLMRVFLWIRVFCLKCVFKVQTVLLLRVFR